MARVDVVMPQMGESITTGTITKWTKKAGDKIEIDEILLEISTDKVESEIPSPVDGVIAEILYPEGETIDVGKVIAVIEDDPANAKAEAPAPAAEKKEEIAAAVLPKPEPVKAEEQRTDERRFYTPLVRAMAKEHGVELSELKGITGTGTAGRVNKADFEAFLEQRKAPAAENSKTLVATPAKTQTPVGERVEVIPMDNMRKAIAKNMVISKTTSAHVNSISEVDMQHLVKFRESVKNDFLKQEGFKLTYSPFIMYAIIQALKDYPLVNASIDGENIIIKKDINLGCAVAVPGNGLVVPVIKNADSLNMLGLCRAVNELAGKARAKKLTLDELQGGTFTFTNVGSFGTLMATPVILQPQVGIYASGVITKRAVVVNDAIAIRPMMYGTHTYDHRLVDGELGGKFLESVHQHLREMRPDALF